MQTKHYFFAGLLALVLAAGGCASSSDLQPAPSANEAARLNDAAVTNVDGVSVTVQPGAWPGRDAVTNEVKPVQVTINNEGGVPLLVRYQQFALTGPQGQRFAALPLYSISDDIEVSRTIEDPDFEYSGYSVAPYYGTAYGSALTPYGGAYTYDAGYYDHYDTYFADIELPTQTMRRRAVPEGVLDSGGRVRGFMYFEKIDDPEDIERVTFRAELVNAETNEVFGEVSIPFTVQAD